MNVQVLSRYMHQQVQEDAEVLAARLELGPQGVFKVPFGHMSREAQEQVSTWVTAQVENYPNDTNLNEVQIGAWVDWIRG